MCKKIVALVLSLVILISVVPLSAFAQMGSDSTPLDTASAGNDGINTVDTDLQYDFRWDEEYPYGTYAFGSIGTTLTEGAADGKDSVLIPVYRLGGCSGASTAIIRYSPYICQLDDQKLSYSWALSSLSDIKIAYEESNPLADYQQLSMPEIKTAPNGVSIQLKEFDGEEEVDAQYPVTLYLSFPNGKEKEVSRYEWQYKMTGDGDRYWRSMDQANEAEFTISLSDIFSENDLPDYDYRLIYETDEGTFCTPSVFANVPFDPSLYAEREVPQGTDITYNKGYIDYKATKEFEDFEFQLTFADGENVKYIKTTVLDNSKFELDEMGVFTLCECIGGELSEICNTFSLTVKDDDNADIKESTVGFTETEHTVQSGEDTVKLNIKRTGDLRYLTTVKYTAKSNTAVVGKNFAETTGEIMLGPDTDTGIVEIPLMYGGENGKDLDFTVELSEVLGGNGKCTIADKKGVAKVIIPFGTVQSVEIKDGVVSSGNNLSSVLGSSSGNDNSKKLKESEESLTCESIDSGEITDAAQASPIYADFGSSNNLGTYDYSAISLRRDGEYTKNSFYWKDTETPYYTDKNSAVNDSVGYILSGAEYRDKGNLTAKSGGKGILACNYDTNSPAVLNIASAGYLFSKVKYRFDVNKVAVVGQFLGIGWNYTMPWLNVNIGKDTASCDFTPRKEKSSPLSTYSFEQQKDISFAKNDFHIDMNETLNDSGDNKKIHQKFYYIPSTNTELQLSNLEFQRRVFSNTENIALRIYTANDGDSKFAKLNDNVYNSLRPEISLVQRASGVNTDGDLYVGSQLCVKLGYSASYSGYDNGSTPSDTVFVTTLDGTYVPAKVERKDNQTYYVTLLWDNMTEADLQSKFRINVVYERRQDIKLNITPSLERDRAGNALSDKDNLQKSWDKVFKNGNADRMATITYSKYTKDENKAKNRFETITVTKPLREIFKDISTPIGLISQSKLGLTNIQEICFGFKPEDKILFNGEQYDGDETIDLRGDEITTQVLNFAYYDKEHLNDESVMTISISHKELYLDGNANGKIDGYYDQSSGLFILDKESGDEFCGAAIDEIPEELIQPTINAEGKIKQYFFKVYYTITPRSLGKGKGTAQILPCFIPQATDQKELSTLTDEQKSYRMVKAGATTVQPYDKRHNIIGKKYDVPDTSEGHEMYGAAATKQSTLDFGLGGDVRAYKKVTINGKETTLNIPDFAGNLRFDFDNPSPLLVQTTSGYNEGIADTNGYLGSFVNKTTFVCGVQPTVTLKSQKDFKAESVANGISYVRPVNNMGTKLDGTPPVDVKENAGGTDNEVKNAADFDNNISLPTASFGALGVSLSFVNVNQVMLSIGIPIAKYHKDFSPEKTETTEKVAGDEKIIEEKTQNKNALVRSKTIKDQKTGKIKSEETEIDIPQRSYSDSDLKLKYKEQKTITEKKNSDGSKERNIQTKRTDIEKNGKRENDVVINSNEKVKPGEDYKVLNDAAEKEKNKESKGGWQKYGDVLKSNFDLEEFINVINSDKSLSEDFADAKKKITERVFDFTVVVKAYAVFEYSKIDGGWSISSASASASATFSLSLKHRIVVCPIFYAFLNITINPEFNADVSFKREYTETGAIVPTGGKKDSYDLKEGDKLDFEMTFSKEKDGIHLDFDGSIIVEAYTDSNRTDCRLRGTLVSLGSGTDVRIKKYAPTLYVRIIAKKDTVINKMSYIGSKLEANFDGFSFYTEVNVDAGGGIGVELLKAEVFLNGNAKFTAAVSPEPYLKEFKLHGGFSLRVKLLLFNFSFDLVGITFMGTRADPYVDMEYKTYFEYLLNKKRIKDTEEDEELISVEAPESYSDTQSFYTAKFDDSNDNAFHPTDPTVKFEISGYSGTGNAFKLADHLNPGTTYKGIDIGGKTYVLYTISNPEEKDNGINASQLVLSKVESAGTNPGIINPITEKTQDVPYVEVAPVVAPENTTGDVAYAYSVEGTKLTVLYTCYNKHFTKEEKPSAGETGKYLVVKTTTIDFADGESAKFSSPKLISDDEGEYRFAPAMSGSTAFYAETASNNANSIRDENLRAYLKAVYGINEEDYTAKNVDAAKVQHIFRYTTQKETKALTGDGSRMIAVTSDGKRHIANVGNNNGEVISEIVTKKVDEKTVVFYLTEQDAYFNTNGKTLSKEEFDSNTDYALITRLYCRTFDGRTWGDAKVLRQIVNFERCTASSPANYPLRDGVYINGALAEKMLDPTISNVKFLDADLDGKGTKPIMIFEMNSNTFLLDNSALVALLTDKEASAKPIFSSDTGNAVTIAADKKGNLVMAYLKAMNGTDNNAIYSAYWDKEKGKWSQGNLFAMGHMSVYENGLKYNLTEEQLEKAYHGEKTGNKEYDEYTAKEGSEKGALDRFSFRSIQLLPSTEIKRYRDETEEKEQLILITDGIFSTLKKVEGELGGEKTNYYAEDESSGLGIYAIAFGAGEQRVGNATVSFDKKEFFCGTALSGKATFTNTGSASIRGSADQPVNVRLLAISPDGFSQVLDEKLIHYSIPAGETVSLQFGTVPLEKDLPEGTEFRLLVCEDEEYIRLSGGVAFSQLTEPVYTVKNGSELMIDSISYKMISSDDEYVYLGTDFVVSNRGNEKANNLFVQFTAVEANDKVDAKEIPLDLRGSELRVSNEEKIANDAGGEADLEHGILKLVDNNGQSHLSPGYMRSVSGMLKIKRSQFSELNENGLYIKCVLYSSADSYTLDMDSNLYEKNDTNEVAKSNNSATSYVPHQTDFNVPNNIVMNLNNTLRIPVSYSSTKTENDIVVREISNGMENWTPVFNDIHYDSNDVIVAVAKHTGQTVIQIEDRKTNSFREIVLDVRNGGFGINIFKDDDTFTFYNPDKSDGKADPISSQWEFRSGTTAWPGEDKPPMAEDYCFIKAPEAHVTFTTVATTLNIYYSGKIKVTSDVFTDKVFVGENTGKKNAPLTVRFDNLESKHHVVTITALSAGTSLDRFTATYAEDTGIVTKSDKSAPSIYWARSFPNTASLMPSDKIEIGGYIADESGVKSLELDGEEIAIKKITDRLYSFSYEFSENRQYDFIATDIDGNKTKHSFAVYWFNNIINQDATSEAPAFRAGQVALVNSQSEPLGENERLKDVYIANSYNFASPKNIDDKLSVYTSVSQDVDLSGKGLTVNDTPPAQRTYQKITEKLARNGFYVSRIVSEDGTWSQVVTDVTQVETEPTKIKAYQNIGESFISIDVDSSKSGLLPRSITVNGYNWNCHIADEVAHYKFDIGYMGNYIVEVFDGIDTYKSPNIFAASLPFKVNRNCYTVNRLNDMITMITVDDSKIIGGYYDAEKSHPEKNEYYPLFETSISVGDRRSNMTAKDISWRKSKQAIAFSDDYYTLGIRSAKDNGGWQSGSSIGLYIYAGKPQYPDRTVLIEGEPLRGNKLEAICFGENPYQYQWFRKDNDGKETDIKGATDRTYTVTPDDYFCYIGCRASVKWDEPPTSGVTAKRAAAKPVAFSGSYDGKEHSLTNIDTGRDDVIFVRSIDNLDQQFESYTDGGTYNIEYYMIYKDMSPEEIRNRQYRGDYISDSVEMKISPLNISNATVKLENYIYDGKPHNPTVKSFTLGDIVIDKYNIDGGKDKTDVGEYAVTIEGVGPNFEGQVLSSWKIDKKNIKELPLKIDYVKKFMYTGKNHEFKIKSITSDGQPFKSYYVGYDTLKDESGKYIARITGTGNYEGYIQCPWEIVRKTNTVSIGKYNVLFDNPVYNGKEQVCEIDVFSDDEEFTDYTVTGNKATEIGEYEMTITIGSEPNNPYKVKWQIVKSGNEGDFEGGGSGSETGQSGSGQAISENKSPQTGDYIPVSLLLAVCWSLAVIPVCIVRRRKSRR